MMVFSLINCCTKNEMKVFWNWKLKEKGKPIGKWFTEIWEIRVWRANWEKDWCGGIEKNHRVFVIMINEWINGSFRKKNMNKIWRVQGTRHKENQFTKLIVVDLVILVKHDEDVLDMFAFLIPNKQIWKYPYIYGWKILSKYMNMVILNMNFCCISLFVTFR